MEDATITQETTSEMYQQGRYPSVVDTDDLVFEIGKMWIWNLNKEKLLDTLLQKSKMLETLAIEAKKEVLESEKKIETFKKSNQQYIINNQKLDTELVKIRTEIKNSTQQFNLELIKIRQKNKELNTQIINFITLEKQLSETELQLREELQDSLAVNEKFEADIKALKISRRKLNAELRKLRKMS